jgi:bifunctional oligoribonuclease and PAP phosphatase NrnA
MLPRIIELIYQYQTFLITSHVRLDGDALGSELALSSVLRGLGKEALIYNQDQTPDNYQFLPGSGDIVQNLRDPEKYDVVFVLDCSELDRIGAPAAVIGRMPRIINIDHHVSNGGFCDVVYIDREASSTGELIYRLIRQMGVPITKDVANNLYAALMTDTGGFCYRNTKNETLYAAGHLVENGAEPQWLSENIYDDGPLERIRLLTKALETLTLDLDGKVGSIVVSLASLAATGAKSEHIEGFVDILRTIKGVLVSILYLELDENYYKLSIRSKGQTNVEQLARRFGGGGHTNAAACKMSGSLTDVRRQVADALRAVL